MALFYYSATGNTRLICEHIGSKIPEMELFDISKKPSFRIEEFGIIGVAIPVFYLSIPPIVSSFLDSLKIVNNKPAFLLTTYGMMPGKSLKILGNGLRKKGFQIFNLLALRMPESFPPFIAKGWTDVNAPNQKEIQLSNDYIESLKRTIKQVESGNKIKTKKITIGFFNAIMPVPSNKNNLEKLGAFIVDEQICVSCGKCQEACVYQAIIFNGRPSFDKAKCYACFACFNKCPQKAISTTKISSSAQYHKPANNLVEKFL